MKISKAIRIFFWSILALALASIPAGFLAAGGGKTVAWYWVAPSEKAFILVHGNSSDRNAMVARARFFHSQGYVVILPDLAGHGETPGRWKKPKRMAFPSTPSSWNRYSRTSA